LAPVGDVDSGDPVAVARDLLERLAPQVPDVVNQADARTGLVHECGGLVERADDRPKVRELALDRLDGDGDSVPAATVGDRTDAVEDRRPVLSGAGEEKDAGRLERREPLDACADRL